MPDKIKVTPKTTAVTPISTPFPAAEAAELEAEAAAPVDETVVAAPDEEAVAVVVFETKYQLAATGSPSPDFSAKSVRLKPTRL